MLTRDAANGFTLVEVIMALLIFMVGVLGLGATSASMLRSSIDLEARELAIQAIDDRLTAASMDPRYEALDSLYAGTETGVFDRFTRVTTVTRTQTPVAGGSMLDYVTLQVVVSGGRLDAPLSRSISLAAP
jgi:Tfp pilus assembly protein PilV